MSLKSLSVVFGVMLAVGCGDSGTGGAGGGTAGGDTGGNPGTGGTPGTGGEPAGAGPEGGSGDGGSPGEGGSGGAPGADLQFNGTGFNPHNGQNLYVQVRDAADAVVADDMVNVSNGTFTFTFTGVSAAGGVIDYYADVNGDNACTNAGEPDHVWREDIPANNVLDVVHNTDFSQIACDGF
jgi:hypothetical protein